MGSIAMHLWQWILRTECESDVVHCCVHVRTLKKASRSCGKGPWRVGVQCPRCLSVLQCVRRRQPPHYLKYQSGI
eukprot:1157669-Pelagomonas_calceolata.AAC.10